MFYIRGLGLGVGVGLPLGVGLGIGSLGVGSGLGLPLGLGFGSGLDSGVGLGDGEGRWLGVVVDGFATSVPVAVLSFVAPALAVVKVHCCVAPAIGDSVNLLPLFLPRNEITGEPAPDICRATAVYPLVFEAMTRPLFPSAVVN
ncbi:MAG TPA: hypothetical protein VFT26_11810 [Pyrinomonadaceae bacterium]|nr:hypothetical protein [Pyrinomonadaceae bacterium]